MQRRRVKTGAQAGRDLSDFLFIEVDARGRRGLPLLPLGLLETLTGAIGDLAEVLTVIVETVEDHPGDSEGGLRHAGNLERVSGSPELSQ